MPTKKQLIGPADGVNMSVEHYRIHEGTMFSAFVQMTVTAASTFDILFKGPTGSSDQVHMVMEYDSDSASRVVLVEGATCASDTLTSFGTTVTTFNRDRNSANTNVFQVFHTPNSPSGGTTLTALILGSAPNKPNVIGGSARNANEWILKPTSKYWMRITNDSASTMTAIARFDFYTGG